MNNIVTALQPVSKAVAAALVGAVIAVLARFGLSTGEDVNNAIEVIVTALVGAVSSYLTVYFAPKNKDAQ